MANINLEAQLTVKVNAQMSEFMKQIKSAASLFDTAFNNSIKQFDKAIGNSMNRQATAMAQSVASQVQNMSNITALTAKAIEKASTKPVNDFVNAVSKGVRKAEQIAISSSKRMNNAAQSASVFTAGLQAQKRIGAPAAQGRLAAGQSYKMLGMQQQYSAHNFGLMANVLRTAGPGLINTSGFSSQNKMKFNMGGVGYANRLQKMASSYYGNQFASGLNKSTFAQLSSPAAQLRLNSPGSSYFPFNMREGGSAGFAAVSLGRSGLQSQYNKTPASDMIKKADKDFADAFASYSKSYKASQSSRSSFTKAAKSMSTKMAIDTTKIFSKPSLWERAVNKATKVGGKFKQAAQADANTLAKSFSSGIVKNADKVMNATMQKINSDWQAGKINDKQAIMAQEQAINARRQEVATGSNYFKEAISPFSGVGDAIVDALDGAGQVLEAGMNAFLDFYVSILTSPIDVLTHSVEAYAEEEANVMTQRYRFMKIGDMLGDTSLNVDKATATAKQEQLFETLLDTSTEGGIKMADIMGAATKLITPGHGNIEDIDKLVRLAQGMQWASGGRYQNIDQSSTALLQAYGGNWKALTTRMGVSSDLVKDSEGHYLKGDAAMQRAIELWGDAWELIDKTAIDYLRSIKNDFNEIFVIIGRGTSGAIDNLAHHVFDRVKGVVAMFRTVNFDRMNGVLQSFEKVIDNIFDGITNYISDGGIERYFDAVGTALMGIQEKLTERDENGLTLIDRMMNGFFALLESAYEFWKKIPDLVKIAYDALNSIFDLISKLSPALSVMANHPLLSILGLTAGRGLVGGVAKGLGKGVASMAGSSLAYVGSVLGGTKAGMFTRNVGAIGGNLAKTGVANFLRSGSLLYGGAAMLGGNYLGNRGESNIQANITNGNTQGLMTGKHQMIGGSALSGAGMGAMIGSFLGPIGTGVGAAIGGVAGAVKGIFDANKVQEQAYQEQLATWEEAHASFEELKTGLQQRRENTENAFFNQIHEVAGGEYSKNHEGATLSAEDEATIMEQSRAYGMAKENEKQANIEVQRAIQQYGKESQTAKDAQDKLKAAQDQTKSSAETLKGTTDSLGISFDNLAAAGAAFVESMNALDARIAATNAQIIEWNKENPKPTETPETPKVGEVLDKNKPKAGEKDKSKLGEGYDRPVNYSMGGVSFDGVDVPELLPTASTTTTTDNSSGHTFNINVDGAGINDPNELAGMILDKINSGLAVV